MTIPNRPPADRDLREHAVRRAELLALLDDADNLDNLDGSDGSNGSNGSNGLVGSDGSNGSNDLVGSGGLNDVNGLIGINGLDRFDDVRAQPGARRRGVVARFRLPLLAAASVAALVTGIAVALPDGDTRSHHAPPAEASNAPTPPPVSATPAPTAKPFTLPATMVAVPAGRELPEALARDFVYRCVLTVPNAEGRAQTALAATFRPYLAVRTPRPGRPDLYFAVAVDDRARIVSCSGDAGPDSLPSPLHGPKDDTAWMPGPIEIEGGESDSKQGRWTFADWGRYTGAVTRVTVDHGLGERDVLMAGGIWYGTMSASRAGEPEPTGDARVRGYDTSGTLIWDSVDHDKGEYDCMRTPDGRVLGYLAATTSNPNDPSNPNGPNGQRDPATCPSAVSWAVP
ncbi:hypothetical protein [Streptomyces sp. SID3343]|uniref:hypothetical protein n=1 Tax=Streptomyces sp. SID3343 TaxID=2690260 RepID=UPI001370F695|nr:hypothetical protein [Streptomyces sp. SID3343]MYW03985.1 hypothetical protein [Streptomyces sp. SID3343]